MWLPMRGSFHIHRGASEDQTFMLALDVARQTLAASSLSGSLDKTGDAEGFSRAIELLCNEALTSGGVDAVTVADALIRGAATVAEFVHDHLAAATREARR